MNTKEYAAKRVNDKLLGYKIRNKLFPGENKYFKENPKVAGMANFETNDIILNPYSSSSVNKEAVAKNEALRLKMNEEKFIPNIEITEDQRKFFKGTEYEGNDKDIKQTIFARIHSKDKSAQATKEQLEEYNKYIKQ